MGYVGPIPRPRAAISAQAESLGSSLSVGGTKRRRAEAGLVIDTQRDERPAAEYRLDSGKAMRLFPPRGQVTVRPCEHTVHTAKFKSSSEPPKEIAAAAWLQPIWRFNSN